MDFLLFLLLGFLIFGAGFFIAGLQIMFALALIMGIFGGLFLLFILIGVAMSPLLLLGGVFFIAWLFRRNTKPAVEYIPPQK